MIAPKDFSCMDDRPDNDGWGGDWPEPKEESDEDIPNEEWEGEE